MALLMRNKINFICSKHKIICGYALIFFKKLHIIWTPSVNLIIITIIIMVIFMSCLSREHIAPSSMKWCEHRIRKKQQIYFTARDGKSYLKYTIYKYKDSMVRCMRTYG